MAWAPPEASATAKTDWIPPEASGWQPPEVASKPSRADLEEQGKNLRKQRRWTDAAETAADLGEQFVRAVKDTPATLINLPGRLATAVSKPLGGPQFPDLVQPETPIIKLPNVTPQQVADALDVVTGGLQVAALAAGGGDPSSALESIGGPSRVPRTLDKVISGGQQLVAQTASGFTTPENVLALPAGASRPLLATFGAGMAKQLPEQVQQGAQVLGDIEAPLDQKIVAGGSPLVTAALLGSMVKGAQVKTTDVSRSRELNDLEAELGNPAAAPAETLTEAQKIARANVQAMAELRAQKAANAAKETAATPAPESPVNADALREALTFNPARLPRPVQTSGGNLPEIPESSPVPEPAATLAAQVEATLNPDNPKAATLVTPGAAIPEEHGLTVVKTSQGTLLVNPEKVEPAQAKQMIDNNAGGQLLGMSTEAKPDGGNVVVQTKTAGGIPVQEEVATRGTIAKAIAAGNRVAPGGSIEIKSPEAVIAERQRANALMPVEITDKDIASVRLAMDAERAPDVLDDIEAHTRGPVRFDAPDFATTLANARQATFTPAGKPGAATKRLDAKISATEGMAADEVLKGMAEENPKYANWTADDLAGAIIDAHAVRENGGKTNTAEARQLAEEQKRTQLWEAAIRREQPGKTEAIPPDQLFAGDEFTVGGQRMRVTGFATDAETGQPYGVELEGAYGKQTVPVGKAIHVDKGSLKSPEIAVAKVEPGVLDKAQTAIEYRLDEIKREGRLRLLGDPEVAMLRTAQGAIYIIKGAKDFAVWSAQMVQKFGREIEPQLKDLWEQAKQVAAGTHPTFGLSEHGIKQIGNAELSQSVRDELAAGYQKLTNESAREIASARIASVGGASPAAEAWLAGKFDTEPVPVQNAIASKVANQLALQQKFAEGRGDTATANRLADQQIALGNKSVERSVTAGQALQSFRMFYEQFTPLAWLRKYQQDIASVARQRLKAATGKESDGTPTGMARDIATEIAKGLQTTHPKLASALREFFGMADTNKGSLEEFLVRRGLAEKGKAAAVARKLEKLYTKEVLKFRRKFDIPEFDHATERELLRRAKAMAALPENSVQRREATLRLLDWMTKQKGFAWHELPLDFWYANVLSGPVTHLKNITGNLGNLTAEVTVQMLRNPASVPNIAEALYRGGMRALPEVVNILRTGHDTATRHAGKFETAGPLQHMGAWALPWKLVGRGLKAEDVMFFYPLQEVKGAVLASRESGLPVFNGRRLMDVRRVMGWTQEARTKAAAQAKAEGLAGNLAARRTQELLEQSRPETLMDNARDFAFEGTFNNDVYGVLGSATHAFEGFSRRHPYFRLVIPFMRVITNIFNSGMNWTPVGYWRGARAQGFKLLVGKADQTGKLFGREVTDPTAIGDLYAKATLGSLALGGIAMAAGQYILDKNPKFMVSGSGPTDPDQRKFLTQSGWLPYSVKIGDRYYAYQNQTWAVPLAIVGHYLDAVRYRKLSQEDAVNRAAFAVASFANVVLQGSWLQGMSSFMQSANQDSARNPLKGLPQQAIRTGSSFVVPNALRQIDQFFDPTKYKAEDIRAMMLNQVPFVRSQNLPDLNVWGQPVSAPSSKAFTSSVGGDSLTQMLAGRRLFPSVPADPYLTPSQTYQLIKLRGPMLRAELLAHWVDISTLPQADAQALVNRISRQQTESTKKMLGLDTLSGIEKEAQRRRQR